MGGALDSGILSESSASISSINNFIISGFEVQISADQMSQLIFGADIDLQSTTFYGCFANNGASVIFYSGVICSNSGGNAIALLAQQGGRISAENSILSDCSTAVISQFGGAIDVGGSTISNNTYGCVADYASTIHATSCTFSGDAHPDLTANHQSMIDAGGSTATEQASNGSNIF